MPTLHWIGKEKVVNHHQDVPFRVLEHQYGFNADKGESEELTESGNKIIHGDNLEALKSLLPEYEGKIKCIYIDPPYNTGNENWVYNDNVNHPKIKKWLGEVVGKEGDDLSRHDKWLCMMYPRLKLLYKLLADDGFIFISLDDNEIDSTNFMLKEIFGERNFQAKIVVRSNKRGQTYKQIAKTHEYLLCFSKSSESVLNGLPADDDKLPYEDEISSFSIRGLRNRNPKFGRFNRPNLFYPIYFDPDTEDNDGFHPISLTQSDKFSCKVLPLNSEEEESCWRWGKEKIENNIRSLNDTSTVFARKKNTGEYDIYEKYRKDTKKAKTIWFGKDVISEKGTKLLKELNLEDQFQFPKPLGLILKVIRLGTNANDNDIVLDSFAGSGTTAHAVQNLNAEDGGNRKLILVEMEDYANSITAERVKRVMKGYGNGKKKTEGTGGSFDYYQLGQPLFDENELLNEEVEESRIREYVWYSETKTAYPNEQAKDAHKHLLGTKDETDYYFFYEKEAITTLNHDFLATIKQKADQYVIYADNCLLSKEFLQSRNIIFKKIPRDISRF